VSFNYHDAAAALVIDGQLVAAIEEERLSRVKHDRRLPESAIAYCISAAGLQQSDIDLIAYYERFSGKSRRFIRQLRLAPLRHRLGITRLVLPSLLSDLTVRAQLCEHLGLGYDKFVAVDHHLSHAASAFYCSPFEDAAVVTVDGVGELTTCGLYRALTKTSGHADIDQVARKQFPHSLGLLYSTITAFLGFEVNEGEYKVMGLAAYGQPRYLPELRKLCQQDADGFPDLDMSYFSFVHAPQMYSARLLALLGSPRQPGQPLPFGDGPPAPRDADAQRFADIAASLQALTEELLLHLVSKASAGSTSRNLCLAGGVFLNAVANGRIIRESQFSRVFIQPAAGDSGGALGAAMYVAHELDSDVDRFHMTHCYWGPSLTTEVTVDYLRRVGLAGTLIGDSAESAQRVAEDLANNLVVGLVDGRSEWGPRSLGNRSILANPATEEMRRRVNVRVKERETFRPFAPAVLKSLASELFDNADTLVAAQPAKVMLATWPLKATGQERVPAVSHADGSARVQIVDHDTSPMLADVLERFWDMTGVPAVMNTSLNVRGQPMIVSPPEAIDLLWRGGLDTLYLNGIRLVRGRL
jgi:carbamoyltransferase